MKELFADPLVLEALLIGLIQHVEHPHPEDQGYDILHVMNRRMGLCRIEAEGFETVVPEYMWDEVMDSLRMEGFTRFVVTDFDETITFDKDVISFDGTGKRRVRPVMHDGIVAVRLMPAGTMMDGEL